MSDLEKGSDSNIEASKKVRYKVEKDNLSWSDYWKKDIDMFLKNNTWK